MPAMTTRFDPFREFWPEVFARLPARAPEGVPAEIRLDVSETPGAYSVRAEMSGARRRFSRTRWRGRILGDSQLNMPSRGCNSANSARPPK